jgi:hypothetical protein
MDNAYYPSVADPAGVHQRHRQQRRTGEVLQRRSVSGTICSIGKRQNGPTMPITLAHQLCLARPTNMPKGRDLGSLGSQFACPNPS